MLPFMWVQDLNFQGHQGPHKNLTTSRPSNASNGIHHQHIKDFTQMSHIIYPTTNQETKTITSIRSSKKTSNQRSTMSKELDNGLKWGPRYNLGALEQVNG